MRDRERTGVLNLGYLQDKNVSLKSNSPQLFLQINFVNESLIVLYCIMIIWYFGAS